MSDALPPSPHPLVTVTLDSAPGARAAGARSARPPPGLEAMGTLAPSLTLEFLTEVASQVHPGRVLCGVERLELLNTDVGPDADARLTARATRDSDEWASVTMVLEGVDRVETPRGSAHARFGHVHPPPPSSARGAQLLSRYRGRPTCMEALYAPTGEGLPPVHERLHVVRWTAGAGLGRLVGELQYDDQLLAPHSMARLGSAPGAVEGMLQLASWLWYSLSGEGSRPSSVQSLRWYRLPAHQEPLLAEAVLRGQERGQPRMDVSAYGQDGVQVMELLGLALTSHPLPVRDAPRPLWEERHRLLQGLLQGGDTSLSARK